MVLIRSPGWRDLGLTARSLATLRGEDHDGVKGTDARSDAEDEILVQSHQVRPL